MKAIQAVTAAAAAAVMGIALAALPHAENDPCQEHLQEVVFNPHERFSWFPLGHHCSPTDFLGASTAVTLAWMAAAGLLLALVLWRHTHTARGAVVGAATLALMGVLYVRAGSFLPAAIGAVVAGCVVGFAIDRWRGLVLPPVVMLAWSFPYLLGDGHAANLVGIAAGAGCAWVLSPVRRAPASLAAP